MPDYATKTMDTLMEYESGAGGLTYRYTYGVQKNSVVVYGIPNGTGSIEESHDYDAVLGVYYAKARLYDAGDKRFLAVDLVKGSIFNPQTLNKYAYVLDNPLKYVDPLGLVEVNLFK